MAGFPATQVRLVRNESVEGTMQYLTQFFDVWTTLIVPQIIAVIAAIVVVAFRRRAPHE